MNRRAECRCGQLSASVSGEPIRISVCHCLDCQRRTGGPFAAQARFLRSDVTIEGRSRRWTKISDSGNRAVFHFCPQCGTDVWYEGGGPAEAIAIAVGAFADPAFPPPTVSVWEERRHPWVAILGNDVEHID